jgi:hypothetical protein
MHVENLPEEPGLKLFRPVIACINDGSGKTGQSTFGLEISD